MAVFPTRPQLDPRTGQNQRKTALFRHWRKTLGEIPGLKTAGRHMLTTALAYVLSAAAFGPVELPLLFGLLMSMPADWSALLAAGAGCLGALTFWQGDVLAELLAGSVVCLLAGAIFAGSSLRKRAWFLPLVCGGITSVLGMTFLLSSAEIARGELGYLLLRVVSAVGAQMVFSRLWDEQRPGTLAAALGLTQLGLSQILVFRVVDLGFLVAAFVPCAGFGSAMAIFSGLGVDLTGITGVSVTAISGLTHLVAKLSHRRGLTVFLPGALSLIWGMATGAPDPVLVLSLTLGGLASAFVPGAKLSAPPKTAPEEARLILGAATLEYLGEVFSQREPEGHDAAMLFDQAASKACTGCAKWQKCWQQDSEQTYCLLAGAVPELLQSGLLPEAFLTRCRRPDAFSEAVSQGVECLRLKLQYRRRLAEGRQALAGQYFFLARFLRSFHEDAEDSRTPRFTQEVAMAVKGFYGRSGNGDRAVWFPGVGSRYYVILCDGMGTGREAAHEGQQAMELLMGMLKTGLLPEEALRTLNDLYVLRQTGGFSTADILEIRLDTGRASLYKWGGAPSYIKRQSMVKRLGTAGPPPGVGIGEEHHPEVIRLSMQRGQTVVLVSDGIDPEEAENRIASCGDMDPKAMVSLLTAGGKHSGEDDCTAVAVCLTPLSPGQL